MGYRRGSVFVRDLREHSRPFDRNQAARILYLAEALEIRTKGKGCRNGALGYTGLAVLRVLLLRFHNRATGLCCPSYAAIQKATGLCRQSVAEALDRLARAGVVEWTRRIIRVAEDGILVCRQASNVYRMAEPKPVAAIQPVASYPRPFPSRGPLAALAALATSESARKAATLQVVEPQALVYCAPVTDWRDRARRALSDAVRRSSER